MSVGHRYRFAVRIMTANLYQCPTFNLYLAVNFARIYHLYDIMCVDINKRLTGGRVKMRKIARAAAWSLSLLFMLIGLLMSMTGYPQGLMSISAGVFLLPPLTDFINRRLRFAPKWWMKLLAFFALAALLNVIVPADAAYSGRSHGSSPGPVPEAVLGPSSEDRSDPSPKPASAPDQVPEPSPEPSVHDLTVTRPDDGTNDAPENRDNNKGDVPDPSDPNADSPEQTLSPESPDTIELHFIDVGQADCILIISGSGSMLVDGGNNADADTVVNYLRNKGIAKLDFVIGTHPHEDHIGGLDAVIDNFEAGRVIMPRVQSNTRTFEDVLEAIARKGLKITSPVPGTEYSLGKAKFTILAPNSEKYGDTNEYSVVIKLEFGNTSFLLTGDAGIPSENEMLSEGYDLQSTVLKVGHHGSKTSTSREFILAVRPQYAVISVGKNNSYGHPAEETLTRLREAGIVIYRTDESGTIVVTSDGASLTFDVENG